MTAPEEAAAGISRATARQQELSILNRLAAAGMSTEQRAYCLAKAAAQLANERAKAEMAGIPEPDSNDEAAVTAYCNRYAEADKRAGVHEAGETLRAAEVVLMDWGREVIARHKDAAKIPPDFWQKAAAHFKFRQQLVDICMRLDAGAFAREGARA